ncbi:unnamed protein product [Gongylonema pulchrum]|uniref:Intraflagellar transport protein n=1 Tax=Gongylonema pulchrum TaxID=637853 RepID=A0A183EEV2_9BILA|nr:unnamed protein product [Gongylonema pulchrum]
MIAHALDLAFRTEQFSALDLIAKELDKNSDPRVLERAAEFFKNNQQYEKAVQLMAYSRNYAEAVELCKQNNVPMSETLAEILTPSKEDVPNQAERIRLLEGIAECCVQQRNYHFAAKKFTQAGNKLEAMRSLLKSGDTEKIVFFATTARNKEICILAANYLQTLNWKEDGDLMKQIEKFYSKANAPEHLASFYEACAQVEIDDYRDYGKAGDALNEALRCIKKAQENNPKNGAYLSEKEAELNRSIAYVKKFAKIRTVYETDPAEAISQLEALADDKRAYECIRLSDIYAVMIVHNARKLNYKKVAEAISQLEALADDKHAYECIRLGDIYAVMIVHNARKLNYKKAYSLIQQLMQREPHIQLSRFISKQMLDSVCDELKMPHLLDEAGDEAGSGDERDEGVEYSYAMKRLIKRNSEALKES